MYRISISTITLLSSFMMLVACDASKPSGGNVTMRDMEVVDGTANDAMADLDNATLDGTALENGAAALAANASAVTNASAPAPKEAPADQEPAKPKTVEAE